MRNILPAELIVIDIETASCAPSFSCLNERMQRLWTEKTARLLPQNCSAEDFYPLRAGVMAEFARVVCISLGCFIGAAPLKFRVKSFLDSDEKMLLQHFLETLALLEAGNSRRRFAGHNIKEFDLPFLCRRLLINGLVIPPSLDFQNMKPWETNSIDSFQYWRFGDYKNFTSLDLLAACLDVPSSKTDIDGSKVGALFHEPEPTLQSRNHRRIADYCQQDVVTTANILLRFMNRPILEPTDVEYADYFSSG